MRPRCLLLPLLLGSCSPTLRDLGAPTAPPVTLRFETRDSETDDFVLPPGAPAAKPFLPFSEGEVRGRLGRHLHSEEVSLRGRRKMPFAQYFALVNDYERLFASLGTSLRDADDNKPLLVLKARAPLAGVGSAGSGLDVANPDGGGTRGHASCLFKGTLDVDSRDVTECLPADIANNGWFGMDLCGAYTAIFSWSPRDQAFSMHAWQNLVVGIVLFGARLDAAKLHNDVDWIKFKGEKGLGPQPGAAFALRGQTQSRPHAEAIVPGPVVYLTVGPEALQLEPAAQISAAVGPTAVPMTPYPEDCSSPDVGTLRIESHPIIRVNFENGSGGDTGVSRFRFDGALTLADDALDLVSELSFRPAQNEIAVGRTLGARYRHLDGTLDVAIDTDLIIARKHWRVRLVTGAPRSGTRTLTLPPRSFSAE